MGKTYIEDNTEDGEFHPYQNLLPLVRRNIGFIFVKDDIAFVRKVIDDNIVPAPARAGIVSDHDVYAPAGPTGCDPSSTNYFQALDIPTKIMKGQIEIVNDVLMVKTGRLHRPQQAEPRVRAAHALQGHA